MHSPLPLIGSAALTLLFAACAPRSGMVRIPRADATSPHAALWIAGSHPMRLTAEDEPRQVSMLENDSLLLTAIAEDRDGGVKASALHGNALVSCRDPASGKTVTRSTSFARRHVPGSSPRTFAPTRREEGFVLRGSDFSRMCPGGLLEGAFGQVEAQAANFHGRGSTSARLHFRVSLSEVAAHAIPYPAGITPPTNVAAFGTGFTPAAGKGGTGFPPGAGAAFAAESPATGSAPDPGYPAAGSNPRCMDPPVPFMSPRRGNVPPDKPDSRHRSLRGPRSAQTSQIPRSRS